MGRPPQIALAGSGDHDVLPFHAAFTNHESWAFASFMFTIAMLSRSRLPDLLAQAKACIAGPGRQGTTGPSSPSAMPVRRAARHTVDRCSGHHDVLSCCQQQVE